MGCFLTYCGELRTICEPLIIPLSYKLQHLLYTLDKNNAMFDLQTLVGNNNPSSINMSRSYGNDMKGKLSKALLCSPTASGLKPNKLSNDYTG